MGGFTEFRLKTASLAFKLRLALVILIEIAYMVWSRYVYVDGLEHFATVELLRTPVRLFAAGAFWLLMPDLIFSRRADLTTIRHPLFWAGVICIGAFSVFMWPLDVQLQDTFIICAATIPVGLHEEFFSRGIVQNLLIRRVGVFWGVLLATTLFTLWHVGATADNGFNYTLIALAGLALGIIYLKTGSIALVAVLHTLSDVLASLPPWVEWNPALGFVSLVIGVSLLGMWAGYKTLPNLPTRN